MIVRSPRAATFRSHRPLRSLRRLILPIACFCFLFASAARGQRQEPCPWLNAATASGALGGEATVSVTRMGDKGDADCLFVRHVESSIVSMRIDVETMDSSSLSLARYTNQCSSDLTPIKAIGNEAFACSLPADKENRVAEQVTGRVRKRAFFVRVSSSVPTADREDLRLKATKIAEEVAGFLF